MSDLLALIGIIVAIILGLAAIIVTLYVHRKQNPRREFSYDLRSSPLVSGGVRGLDKLTVAFDGSPLKSPHLVSVLVASTGRADISSASFDGDKPIKFELNVPILGEIAQTANIEKVSTRLNFIEGESSIELQPSLLPKGFTIRATYLCDGHPKFRPRIELADIVIHDISTPPPWHRDPKWLNFAANVLFVVAGVLFVVMWIFDL